jgi:uncharacterized protein (DUF1697 family)
LWHNAPPRGGFVESRIVARYVAFLRGINVGGHTVKMELLRRRFEDLGFGSVSTFIASGNVLFEAEAAEPAALERRIEEALRAALGYDVATFLRTGSEVASVAAQVPFPDADARPGDTMYVLFLRAAPDETARRRVSALSTDQDLLHVVGRELYWLRRGSLRDSTINDAALGKALGAQPTTMRNLNTLRRLAAKLAAPASQPKRPS